MKKGQLFQYQQNTSGTRVVHCKREPYDVYIGRPSKWGNPFPLSMGRTACINAYEKWILTQPQLLADLHELKDKTLGCWCKPKPCHGDVLVKLIKQLEEQNGN